MWTNCDYRWAGQTGPLATNAGLCLVGCLPTATKWSAKGGHCLTRCWPPGWFTCALQRMRLEAEAGRLQTAMDEAAQVLRHSEQRLRRAQLAQLIALGADMQSAEVQLAALRPGR